ncbi:HNH endonuclease [Bacillus subtilis]
MTISSRFRRMQLVDQKTQQKTGHTGGRHLWGGGSKNR